MVYYYFSFWVLFDWYNKKYRFPASNWRNRNKTRSGIGICLFEIGQSGVLMFVVLPPSDNKNRGGSAQRCAASLIDWIGFCRRPDQMALQLIKGFPIVWTKNRPKSKGLISCVLQTEGRIACYRASGPLFCRFLHKQHEKSPADLIFIKPLFSTDDTM